MPHARKPAKRTRTALSPSLADSDASSAHRADEPAVEPKPKKARTAGTRVKGRRGAMSAFTSIPLDLLFDICFNLEPRDLLALSTTSKVFRSVVTGASSGPLWVAARERVGLPELEHPMTDLQYAHLLFGKGCSFCSRKNAGKPEVSYRARICQACMKDKFADAFSPSGAVALDKYFNDAEKMHPFTLLVANHTTPDARHHVPQYCLEEIGRVSTDLHRKFPEAALDSRLGDGADSFYFILSRTSGQPRSQADPTGVTDKSTPFERWWFAEREEGLWAKQEDAIKLRKWLLERQHAQAVNKEGLRDERRKDIVRRLEDQGFTFEEFDLAFHRHSLTNKPELLTERTWTTVEATLKPILLASRSTRRRRHFEEQIAAYQATANASALAAYYPVRRFDLSSLPAWQSACTVDGFVELDELWASHKDTVINELDELVRSRIEAMLRAVANAYVDAVSAQERDDADDLLPAARPSSITVPPLPSFLPCSTDEPIVATDEQLVEFLGKNPLSIFISSCCGKVQNGESALKHASSSYCVGYDRNDVAAWALCDQGGRRDLKKLDGTTLLRVRYLQDLLDSTALVPPDDAIEDAFEEHGLVAAYPHLEDRLVKVPKCGCGTYSSASFITEPLFHIYRHIVSSGSSDKQHTVTVDVEYSEKFLIALYRAEVKAGKTRPLGKHEYMGKGFNGYYAPMFDDPFDYGSDNSMFDSEESYDRDDCCVM
ncbi:hypothetical protein JCM9279_005622 [Rhodotorula babjevae]